MRQLFRVASLAMVCVLASPAVHGQLNTATLSGTVMDATGSVVPGATVKIVQTQTNSTRTDTTGKDGSYREELLPVGPYKITVEAPGFKKLEQTGIVLSVMQNAEFSPRLQVGSNSESVNVTADVPLVNLGDSTLGNTVSNVEIDNLPLVNRDVSRLLQLVPGVQSVSTVNSLGYQELKVLVNGSTDGFVGQVSYYLDGGLNMTGLRNSGNQVPNPDAVDQFNVVTNNYSAQLGRFSSAVVSVVTKTGTNKFHGSLFEFYRSRNFNAAGFNSGGNSASPYNQHRFGGTVGGPIRHDKDFFFASLGAFRYISYTNHAGSLPSDAQLTGNFAENLPLPGEQKDCLTAPSASANTGVRFLVCNPATRTPYANNRLPAVDPTAINILRYVKANLPAQQPAQAGDTRYTYRTRSATPQSNEEYLFKTDHQLTAKHRLSLSYFMLNYRTLQDLGGFLQNWSYSNYANKQQNANASDVWNISDRSVNQFWLSYTRQNGGRVPVPGNSTLADFGSDFGVVGTPSRSNITVGGVEGFTLAQAITGPKAGTNLYAARDILTTTRGRHSLFLGGEASLEKDFQQTTLNNYGTFTFSTTNGPSSARTTNGLSDFLAGTPVTMGQDTGIYAQANYFSYAVFAQDDWRIVPRLTLNLGIRYDWQQAPSDPQQRQTNFVPGQQSTAFNSVRVIGTGRTAAPLGMLFPGDAGVPASGAFTPRNHVSPRLGFAYDAYGNGKTVVHGGAGLFFGGISGNQWEFPSNFAPYAIRNSYSKVVSLTHPYQGDPTEFPTGSNPYPQLVFDRKSGTATFLPLTQVVAFDPNYRWPYSYQINFGVQQQFGARTALSVNYVASLNRKTPLYNDINGPQFNVTAANTSGPSCVDPASKVPDLSKACGYANTSATVNNRRPLNNMYGLSAANPTFSNVWIIRSNQNSNYNGLQVSLEQRITHRVSARGYYTWSKTLQSNALDSTGGLNGVFVDSNLPQLEYRQRSDQDRRHMMTASIVWKPDYFDHFNRFTRFALNGWTATAIWTANSGQPFTVTTGNDNYFSGLGNNRPSVLPGRQQSIVSHGGSRVAARSQWFDTSVYCRPGVDAGCPGVGPLGLIGNTRPATLSAPGYRNVDASIFRDFHFTESVKFQFRGEAQNVFNLVNLGVPSAALNAVNFGQVTTSGGGARILQVGGRLLF